MGGEKSNYIELNSNFPVYISKPDPDDAHYPPQSTPKSSSSREKIFQCIC